VLVVELRTKKKSNRYLSTYRRESLLAVSIIYTLFDYLIWRELRKLSLICGFIARFTTLIRYRDVHELDT
jgi:hypothetical protein